ncbi:MAG: phosphopyruvate hydratase, partial [Candidatus Levybacteria bacterium]|nr:phosphopyruvate hydratase [Candidatus Levybacteria bacterium]
LLSIEDPFSEDDKLGFVKICQLFKDNPWIIGDDLTVTNKDIIQKVIDEKQVTGVIIKPNQIGSVSETLDSIKLAQSYNLKTIVSHRSGETNDDFIADLAFGCEADGLKSGAPTQPQRLAKYNRLIEIEKQFNM